MTFPIPKGPKCDFNPKFFSHIPARCGAEQRSTSDPFKGEILTFPLGTFPAILFPASFFWCVLALPNPPNEIGCSFFNIIMHCMLFFPSSRVIRRFLNAHKRGLRWRGGGDGYSSGVGTQSLPFSRESHPGARALGANGCVSPDKAGARSLHNHFWLKIQRS